MSNEIHRIDHNIHRQNWEYVACICAKYDIKPYETNDDSVDNWVTLSLKNENIDITWYIKEEDREQWQDYWASGGNLIQLERSKKELV